MFLTSITRYPIKGLAGELLTDVAVKGGKRCRVIVGMHSSSATECRRIQKLATKEIFSAVHTIQSLCRYSNTVDD